MMCSKSIAISICLFSEQERLDGIATAPVSSLREREAAAIDTMVTVTDRMSERGIADKS